MGNSPTWSKSRRASALAEVFHLCVEAGTAFRPTGIIADPAELLYTSQISELNCPYRKAFAFRPPRPLTSGVEIETLPNSRFIKSG
jgi:hypothetical protein